MNNIFKATLVFSTVLGASSVALAHGKAGPGPRGEKCKPPAEVMQKFDGNGDGKLDHDERVQMHQARKAEMLAKYDTNKDGQLGDDERKALWTEKKQEHFARMDADGNGSITMQEAEAGCGPLKRFFLNVDANNDGVITTQEFDEAKPPRDHADRQGRRGFKRR